MTPETPEPSQDDKRYEKTYGIEERYVREITLEGPGYVGPVELKVRTEGAMVRDLKIGGTTVLTSKDNADPETGQDFVQPVRTDGTITMLPVGPGLEGPQHGASRYLDYAVEHSAGNALELMAKDKLKDLGHLKTFTLEPDGMSIKDDIVNKGHNAAGLSVGEHFYFNVQEANLALVSLLDEHGAEQSISVRKEIGEDELDNGKTVPKYGPDETGPLSQFLPDLLDGKTLYFSGFTGSQDINIPGIGKVNVGAQANSEGHELAVGLLVWHRPGSPTLCFEPVVGFSIDDKGHEKNDGIAVAAENSVVLETRIRLKK